MTSCLFDVRKHKEELIGQICAWVSVHCMFGGRHFNCEELRLGLRSEPLEDLRLVVRILYCDGGE